MALQTQDFVTLVRNQTQSIQGSARNLIDFTIGSVLRAMVEANAGVVLWLQGLILQLLATTRAATSNGSDLDSWGADYNFFRIGAVAATGQETFGRYTPTLSAIVPVGAQVQSSDGTQTFTVIADTNNVNYTVGIGYVLVAGVTTISATVQALVASALNNVAAGGVNTITQAISGIDYCTNVAGFNNGANAETDAAFRVRFVAYIQSLSKATKAAIGYAISSVQIGIVYTLVENVSYAGTAQPGYFYAVVDDGSGAPPAALLASVGNAVDLVRGFCITFDIFSPVIVTANVSMTIITATGYTHSTVVAQVIAALTAYINTLPLGTALTYTHLAQIAYNASPGVTNVISVLLNSGTADLAATPQQVVKAGAISVS